MNPEFYRNLLLELSLHRLLVMPLILLLIFAAAGLGGSAETISETAQTVMIGLLVLWGTRLAADSVLGEVRARTWDSQRMSGIGPFAMSWAKLFGSTIYVWYGAALSVPALLYEWAAGFEDLLRIVIFGLAAQAVALFVSLLVQRMRPERLRFQVTASQLFGLGAALVYGNLLFGRVLGFYGRGTTEWYGVVVDKETFTLATGIAFLAWTLFGIYRLMRAELQFRCWPVGWTAFVLFCAIYVGGFVFSNMSSNPTLFGVSGMDAISRLLPAYLTTLGLVWLAVFVEPKGLVRLRRWGAALNRRDSRRILESTPAWFPGMWLGLVVGLVLLTQLFLSPEARDVYAGFLDMESLVSFVIAMFLFLLRDIGLIHFVTLDGRKRRAQMTALVYLVVLYVLFPVVLAAAGWEGALPVFLPFLQGPALVIVVPVLVQVGLVAALLGWRWRRVAASMREN